MQRACTALAVQESIQIICKVYPQRFFLFSEYEKEISLQDCCCGAFFCALIFSIFLDQGYNFSTKQKFVPFLVNLFATYAADIFKSIMVIQQA